MNANASVANLENDRNIMPLPRTELDSHANIVVMGNHSFSFHEVNNRICEVTHFNLSIGTAKHVPIVGPVVAYNCQYSHKTCILVFKNALYITILDYNLIPLFILNEAGLVCNEKPKIHCDNLSHNDHCIFHKEAGLHIPLQLNGIFSFFHSWKPTSKELNTCNKVFLTPDSSN